MASEFSLRQLLDAGVHLGHQVRRWNPLMRRYIYCERGGVHIIDLTKTVPMLSEALEAVRSCVAKGGNILFVGTKPQARQPVADAATSAAQFYVNSRWLGGTLTNWVTVSKSIAVLKELRVLLDDDNEDSGRTKKEMLSLQRKKDKLETSLGGISDLKGPPDMLIVIDTNRDGIAIEEARKLGIRVIAVVDTNSNPTGITYPIPGNDDASRAVQFYCNLFSKVAIDGMSDHLSAAGAKMNEFTPQSTSSGASVSGKSEAVDGGKKSGKVTSSADDASSASSGADVSEAASSSSVSVDIQEEVAGEEGSKL